MNSFLVIMENKNHSVKMAEIMEPLVDLWRKLQALTPEVFHSEYVPEDLVVIGEMAGDGEVVCFSKETGEFVEYFEGEINNKMSDFDQVIHIIFKNASPTLGLSKYAIELFMKRIRWQNLPKKDIPMKLYSAM